MSIEATLLAQPGSELGHAERDLSNLWMALGLINQLRLNICAHNQVSWTLQIKVNWAFGKDEREDTSEHHHIFVGDLCSSTTDARLFEAFQQCEQCSNARVMRDHTTHR